jgi:hypothetical protein
VIFLREKGVAVSGAVFFVPVRRVLDDEDFLDEFDSLFRSDGLVQALYDDRVDAADGLHCLPEKIGFTVFSGKYTIIRSKM